MAPMARSVSKPPPGTALPIMMGLQAGATVRWRLVTYQSASTQTSMASNMSLYDETNDSRILS